MLDHVISKSDLWLIKDLLESRLPFVKATDRVEAMARGLGFTTYGGFRQALKSSAPIRVKVDDKAFTAYLKARGVTDVPPGRLESALDELDEIDNTARNEMLSSMPDTLEDCIAWLESHDETPDVTDWARAFGAIRECYCGATVIQPGHFTDEVLEHYKDDEGPKVENAFNRVYAALVNSGHEVGEGGMGGELCGYHADQEAKDRKRH